MAYKRQSFHTVYVCRQNNVFINTGNSMHFRRSERFSKGKKVKTTTAKSKLKPDIVLKNFWRDNARFADLFNGTLFHGDQILTPHMLLESDTDVSSVLKFNSYAETLRHIPDVVKKSAYGIDFVILSLENQMKVHYAMPLRHMAGDALIYMKEYSDTVRKNKKDRLLHTASEILSGLRKEDRLHAVISLCVYYGETDWDGPRSLLDMIQTECIPIQLKSYVNDYRMHLVQINDSDVYRFQNTEVEDFFTIMRSIYRRDYHTIEEVYGTNEISAELGLAIGVAAKSGILIRKALKTNDNGGVMNMCTALKELMNEGIEQGKREGIEQGKREGIEQGKREGLIEGIIKTYREFGLPQGTAVEKIQTEYGLTLAEAQKQVAMYY